MRNDEQDRRRDAFVLDTLLHPAQAFGQPSEVLADPDLTPNEKRAILALLWQIYSRRRSLQIHFWQCGHRRGGGRAMSSRMAWRTAGRVG